MESIQIRRHFSRNILLRMLLLGAATAALLYWKLDFINDIYFRDQITPTGLIINGTILALFVLGMLRIIGILLSYSLEERALIQFMRNLRDKVDPIYEISEGRMIARRYRTLEVLSNANTPINHNALATTLVASESTRNSLPKFINNTLILTGVFGTIVSLSIALIGASDLLASAVNVNGMGVIIHGMSTALSTTITAIVSYIFFGYFYMKLTDVQTNLISGIEQITATHLMPRFQIQTESVLFEFSGLIRSLQSLISKMEASQSSFQNLANEMQNSQSNIESLEQCISNAVNKVYDDRIHPIAQEMNDIKKLLRDGFRLHEEP
ncbi:MAG: hypothetical protein OQK42_05625 [Sedimenticola sp.]|nr:hypothetical protein [Sedimenticola sp.]MCW8883557.1 hypothetical protein [Sedimenticola sp.]MCW8946286.1 hypothetical protein [Sedimenticola sp.]MCW9022429.1 hypothetical protein [Sedimenticola sp.]MDF1527625.1 hypothetical protein [Sedimenticola sp.]